jgi:hypothetical protein
MKSEQILALPPLVLSQEQREFYFENGYLLAGPAFHEGRMIRGQPARWVEFDAGACQLPPDRSSQPGVTIFSAQNREHSV